MSHFENIVWQKFTILSAASVSEVFKTGGASLVAIKVPAGWAATQDIAIIGAVEDADAATETTDLQRLYNQAGALEKFAGAGALLPDTIHWIDPKATFGLKQVQLESVNEGTDVAEVVAADRVGMIGLRPVD